MDLQGQRVLVIGGSSGIGLAVAQAALAAQAQVTVASSSWDRVQRAIARLGGGEGIQLDVTDEAAWEEAIQRLLSTHGRLDILVNSAGVSAAAPLAEMALTEWRRVLAVNLDGAFLGTKHAIQAMRETGGSIVHVSSASGIKAAGGAAAYSAGKAGLCMLAKAAAKETWTALPDSNPRTPVRGPASKNRPDASRA